MTTYAELAEEVRDQVDATDAELSDSAMLNLMKRAVRDVIATGALIDLNRDTTSITLAASTWEYAVPANFIYIHHLAFENTVNGTSDYSEFVPRMHWDIVLAAGTSTFAFLPHLFDLRIAKKVGVFGQSKPAVPTALTDTVDTEVEGAMQAALEVRVLSRLSQMSIGQGQGVGIDRANQRREAKVQWDGFTQADYRVFPNSTRVKGR